MDKIINYVAIGVALVGGGFFLNRYLKQQNKNEQESKLLTSPEGQNAQQLRAAFNPAGASWLSWGDGTNVTAIMKTAANIKDFAKLSEAYRNLYNRNISDDLTNELTSKELMAFYNVIKSKNPSVIKWMPKFIVGQKVINNITPFILFKIENNVLKVAFKITKVGTILTVGSGNKIAIIGKSKEIFTQIYYNNKMYFVKQRHINLASKP